MAINKGDTYKVKKNFHWGMIHMEINDTFIVTDNVFMTVGVADRVEIRITGPKSTGNVGCTVVINEKDIIDHCEEIKVEEEFIVELKKRGEKTILINTIQIPDHIRGNGYIASSKFSNPCSDRHDIEISSSILPEASTYDSEIDIFLNGDNASSDGTAELEGLCCTIEQNAVFKEIEKILKNAGATVTYDYKKPSDPVVVKEEPKKPLMPRLSKEDFLKELNET